MIQRNEEFVVIKTLFWFVLTYIKKFWMAGFIVFIYLSTTRNCHHIWVILVNTSIPQKKKIHFYYKMSKIILNLGSNKFKNNNNSTYQLSCLFNLLLISIVDTHEKDLSNVDSEIRHDKITYIFSKFIINIISLLNTCNV